MLVSDNNGYRVYCDTSEIMVSDKKYIHVRFYTEYADAKDPAGKQVKFQMILTEQEFENYRSSLNAVNI